MPPSFRAFLFDCISENAPLFLVVGRAQRHGADLNNHDEIQAALSRSDCRMEDHDIMRAAHREFTTQDASALSILLSKPEGD